MAQSYTRATLSGYSFSSYVRPGRPMPPKKHAKKDFFGGITRTAAKTQNDFGICAQELNVEDGQGIAIHAGHARTSHEGPYRSSCVLFAQNRQPPASCLCCRSIGRVHQSTNNHRFAFQRHEPTISPDEIAGACHCQDRSYCQSCLAGGSALLGGQGTTEKPRRTGSLHGIFGVGPGCKSQLEQSTPVGFHCPCSGRTMRAVGRIKKSAGSVQNPLAPNLLLLYWSLAFRQHSFETASMSFSE